MPNRRRIAYVTSAYGRVSDTFIRNEVVELRTLGHDVLTFSIRRPELGDNAPEEVANEQANTVYLLERGWAEMLFAMLVAGFRTPLRFCQTLRMAWRLSQPGLRSKALHCAYFLEAVLLARYLRADSIEHLHNHIGENSASVAMLAAHLAEVPFSLAIHGPGIFFAPEKWSLQEKLVRSKFSTCITHFCRSQCMIFAPPEVWPRLHLIRCSVQRQFLTPSVQDNSIRVAEIPHFVSVGRLCSEKGQLLLVDAVAELVAEGHSLRLSIVGDGPLRSELERRIAQHDLFRVVQLLGSRGSQEVCSLLHQAVAFVLPSFAEGLPVVIMEALAVGCPVVTTSIAGIPELVRHGENGWLITPGSTQSLVNALREVLTTEPRRLREMGRAGASRVREHHNPIHETKKLAALIESACRDPRGEGN